MSKYRMLKCSICDGFGLVKKTEKDICNHCKDSTIKGCCYCEFYFCGGPNLLSLESL